MKKTIIILSVLLTGLFCSCVNDLAEDLPYVKFGTNTGKDTLFVTKDAQSVSTKIISNVKWVFKGKYMVPEGDDLEWYETEEKDGVITVDVTENETLYDRIARIAVRGDGIVQDRLLIVSQEGSAPFIRCEVPELIAADFKGTYLLPLYSNVRWKIEVAKSGADWIELHEEDREGREGKELRFTVISENTSKEDRSLDFTIYSDFTDVELPAEDAEQPEPIEIHIKITQLGSENYFEIGNTDFSLKPQSQIIEVPFESNKSWTLSTEDTWLHPEKLSGDKGELLKIQVDANDTENNRSGSLELVPEGRDPITINVFQTTSQFVPVLENGNAVTVKWNPVSDATGYKVKISETGGNVLFESESLPANAVLCDLSTQFISLAEEKGNIDVEISVYAEGIEQESSKVSLCLMFGGGEGSESDPYIISCARHLTYVNSALAACYLQTEDVDLSAFIPTQASFAPIGQTESFSGRYDGQGHVISSAKVVVENASAGIFSQIAEKGEVRNLKIKDVFANAKTAGGSYYAGGIVGMNSGKVTGCVLLSGTLDSASSSGAIGGIVGLNAVTGTVENCITEKMTATGSRFGVGGICGINLNRISGCVNRANLDNGTMVAGISALINPDGINAVIENCVNEGHIKSNPKPGYAAGIVAKMQNKSSTSDSPLITGCYNVGVIEAANGAGGIAGWLQPAGIENCYNAGAVSAGWASGGICANINKASDRSENIARIENCYNVGTVGGLSGSNPFVSPILAVRTTGGNIDGCHFLQGSAKTPGGVEITTGIANDKAPSFNNNVSLNTEEEMKSQSTFANWDFANVWIIDSASEYGYPQLKANRHISE